MATPITPKSLARENHNLQVGYGEIPGFMKNGQVHYALPCGKETACINEAKSTAQRMDDIIRSNMAYKPSHTLH